MKRFCPCGCTSNYWVDDPDCIRHSTPLERYRAKLAAGKVRPRPTPKSRRRAA